MRQTGNNRFLKEFNRSLFLDILRQRGFVSKADLAKITGLSPTAAGTIVESLLENDFIEETGAGESSGGRKPILYTLRQGTYFSIGVDVDVLGLNFIVIDLTGKECFSKYISTKKGISAEEVGDLIAGTTEKIIEELKILKERLIGIGISVPGFIDVKTSEIVMAANLGWKNSKLSEQVEKQLGVKVFLENEAMSSAVCENWVGKCQGIDNFICINVKTGIGAGIFAEGRLYRGSGGSAGEVGHIVVDENGPLCGCGNHGCLETISSTSSILKQAKEKFDYKRLVISKNDKSNELSIEDLAISAKLGDLELKAIFEKSAHYLGIAISNLVNSLNPSVVVIGKEFVKYAELSMDEINKVVKEKALSYPASQVTIISSSIGEKSSTLGAAIIPLKVIFGK